MSDTASPVARPEDLIPDSRVLAGLYFSSNRWAFEQPHEYVPLVILALVPSGRVWGLDAWVLARRPDLRRWRIF